MDVRTVEQISEWDSRPFSGGFETLHTLADEEFSGAVDAGGAWLFMLNSRVIGVFDGTIDSFEDADGTLFDAPHPSLPLLFSMKERGGKTQAKYYTNDTPLKEASETLASNKFTGYIELSENVLSGDYYVVYHGGRSMSAAYVGQSEQLYTGDEALSRANDEVGIYEVVAADVNVIDLPEIEESEPKPDPEPASTPESEPKPDPSQPRHRNRNQSQRRHRNLPRPRNRRKRTNRKRHRKGPHSPPPARRNGLKERGRQRRPRPFDPLRWRRSSRRPRRTHDQPSPHTRRRTRRVPGTLETTAPRKAPQVREHPIRSRTNSSGGRPRPFRRSTPTRAAPRSRTTWVSNSVVRRENLRNNGHRAVRHLAGRRRSKPN